MSWCLHIILGRLGKGGNVCTCTETNAPEEARHYWLIKLGEEYMDVNCFALETLLQAEKCLA